MIAIGGSLGGCDALQEILRRLPADFPQPIAVVLHRSREAESLLVPLIQRTTLLPVIEVEDKEPIRGGCVYLCPADYHLMLDRDCFALSTDELVNFARPSIDVLFESAAEWERRKTVAVVLSGGGTDGSRGVARVHDYGGTVLIQDPKTAEGPWMPNASLQAVPTAHVLTLDQIAKKLVELSRPA